MIHCRHLFVVSLGLFPNAADPFCNIAFTSDTKYFEYHDEDDRGPIL